MRRPIYGPSDPRWVELEEYMAASEKMLARPAEERFTAADLRPLERAGWHEIHVLGINSPYRETVYPPFPDDVASPEWATGHDDSVSVPEDLPMRTFYVDVVGADGSVSQEVTFDPETGVLAWSEPRASVWAGGSERVEFGTVADARAFAAVALATADALEAVQS